uniref:Ion transport domain-containing protein n=2 Tax=Timema TaxID=61471 RepID=A0A7R8ZAG0_TIMDO|nr:unnamed protein product [Timema douglasi]
MGRLGWVWDEDHWLFNVNEDPVICGNTTGARHCPEGYFCVQVGENPNHGYTNFDNFLWSMLTTFQLITLDYWENVYNMVLASCGPMSVVFFTVVVFFGSFYLINLMLAVVALSYEEEAEITQEEKRKDLTDHRDDSTFSFDPSNINVKQLEKNKRKRLDSRKGVLLASYTRKKTRRRKRGRGGGAAGENGGGGGGGGCGESQPPGARSRSVTPSPRHSTTPQPETRPQTLTFTPAPPRSPGVPQVPEQPADTLHPANALVLPQRGQLLSSRHPSSNTSDNRESSLDDSGVVDDHEEGDVTSEEVTQIPQQRIEPVTISLMSPKEIRVIKCNGVSPGLGPKKQHMYTLPSDYLSHIVVLDDLPDRNCDKCTQCCVDYEGWLRFQSGLYKVVRDPLFDLLITLCIVLNTMFLAMEHHGMSESVRQALDIGNKVFTSIFSFECFLKLMALSKEYFACGWNIFDLIIVSASLLDLSFELVDGLSVLRGLRLLRVLKLAQSWTTMKVLLSIIISTIGALGNLTFVLVIVIYIFAVIGMQLFSKDYTVEIFAPDPVPRWNFNDFFHSFMMIFRILCGEWIEPLWDCMRAEAVELYPSRCWMFQPDAEDEETAEYKALLRHHALVVARLWRCLWGTSPDKPTHPYPLFQRCPFPPNLRGSQESALLALSLNERIYLPLSDKQTWSRRVKSPQRNIKDTITSLVTLTMVETIQSGNSPTVVATHVKCAQRAFRKHQLLSSLSSLPWVGYTHHKEAVATSRPPAHSRRIITYLGSLFEYRRWHTRHQLPYRRDRFPRPLKRRNRERNQNEKNMRLEEMVREVMGTSERKSCGVYTSTTSPREVILRMEVGAVEHPPHPPPPSGAPGINARLRNDEGDFQRRRPPPTARVPTPRPEERRPYSQSVQESLDRHAKEAADKRYSLVLPRGAVDGRLGAEDGHPVLVRQKAVTLQDEEEGGRPGVSPQPRRVPWKQDGDRNLPMIAQQSSSKDESNTEESIELEVLDKGPGETDTMLQNPAPEAVVGSPKHPWHALVSYVDELTVGGRRDSQGHYVDGMGSFPGFGCNKPVKVPQECFPQHCFQRCTCCDRCLETKCGRKWMVIRTSVLSVVDTPMFEWFILVLIFASSITLCFEDIYLDDNPFLKNILYWTNLTFCVVFSVEMLLKWLALGFWKYFTSFWTILDFIIVFVSVFSLLIEENENLKVLRSLRTLRALRPLRAISRWQGMRIVVNALMYAIPSIFNVLLVCLVFWLIFSIMGVQFFGGKFFKCVDEEGELLPIEATFEGWMEVMADAVDARGVDLQPQREANLYAYIYFVIFIVCGSFFTLNLFIGVIIDNFNMLKKKYEGGVLEMFLTESQKHYYTAMKKLGRKKPQKVIKRPINQFLAMFYDLSNSRRFEIAIFVLIFLNMLTMGIEHFNQAHAIFFILEVSNAFFTTVFGLEALVKIIGLRHHYFTVPWNMFDFLLVMASILGILMEDIMIDFPVSPTLLRVVRVFRIGRILRLIKASAAKGIRKLLFALVVSLPALFNIGALLALITFIYAIIGMSVFGHVRQQGALDDMVNFETFGRSMQLLFRFDPHATQFIRFTQLSDFIASLDPPLGIPKPNIVALVSFNLPIARGNKIHCLDILHALVKYVLGHVEESEDFKKLQDQMDIKFKKQFPTRKELEIVSSTRIWKRQDKAARLIQSSFREYLRLKREREREPLDLEDEMTQTSSPGGWQSRLSAFLHVHRGSRASSRKSSRASDASDMSELGGPWLNLPLLFLSAAQATGASADEAKEEGGNGKVCIMVSEPSPETGGLSGGDRQSEEPRTSRSGSGGGDSYTSRDVSILVTHPSPDTATPFVEVPTTGLSPHSTSSGSVAEPTPCEDRASPSPAPSTPIDLHPLGLRPGGASLSLLPVLTSEPPTRKPSSESESGLMDKHPVRFRPGTGLSLCPGSEIPTDTSPPPPPVPQRKFKKSVVTPPPPRRMSKRPFQVPLPPPRLRRTQDSTLVHVLVHRESEESGDDKGS